MLLFISGVNAQSFFYGNTWYKDFPDRTYIKLIVETDGIYRVSLSDLQSSGFDLSSVNPDNLKLYYRGEEVPIYTEKNGSALSYLEFFGERNDGKIDSIMYRDPNTGKHVSGLQPNRNLSLFTDEAAYFLTWDNTPSSNRYFSNFDPTYSGRTPISSFLYESRLEYTDGTPGATYIQGGGGPYEPFFTLNCDYGPSEGYVGPSFAFGSARTLNVPTPAPANTAAPLEINMRIFGRSSSQHIFKAELNGDAANPIIDTTINTSAIYIKTYQRTHIPSSNLSDDTDITFRGLRASVDNNHVVWTSITYQRLPDLRGDSLLKISDHGAGTNKVYFRLENATGDADAVIYDVKNRFRNVGKITNGIAEVLVQGFPNTRDLYFGTDKGIKKPRIEASKLNKLFDPNAGADYVIITHRNLAASATAYANYRDTATVSPVSSVKVVYTDEIYDEYGYGSLTPWAIKRFCKDALDNWNTKPRYFLIWGKGKYRTRNVDDNLSMVPTFGFPATDYEFVGHFDQNSSDIRPEAAIGRINLFSDSEGIQYLNKVNDYEHTPWSPWMKKGTFLGGGGTLGEQNAISNAFNFMIDIYEGNPYGGSSFYFQKNSATQVIDPEAASYHDEITKGVSVIHFFGHSTSNINDVSIREPFEYNNYNRYPFMLAMGCFGGDFTVGQSFGERWVLEPNRGAIAYMGNSSAGYLNPLRDYGKIFYNVLYDQRLSQPIGEAVRTAIISLNDSLSGIQFRNHSRQMNLQGDPAIVLYAPSKTDLEITESNVFFEPSNFSAQDDSFKINVIINNFGLVSQDSFELKISQRLPDNSVKQHLLLRKPMIGYIDTFTYTIVNTAGNALAGQNFFDITVDGPDEIDEYREDNNRVSKSQLVPGNIPAVLYPTEYAVVGDENIRLEASTVFMTTDDDVSFVFEIDTTERFNSSSKVSSGTIRGTSIQASWDVPFSLSDSTVYYWRVRLSEVEPSVWTTSSFKYIKDRQGWAQSRLNQFTKNTLESVTADEFLNKWKFKTFTKEYEFVVDASGGFLYSINGSLEADLSLQGFASGGVGFVVLDKLTLSPTVTTQISAPVRIGAAIAPTELYKLKNAIQNANEGDYIIVGSHKNPRVPEWTEDVFDALKQIGVSDNVKLLQDGQSFLVMGRKGLNSGATEIYAPTSGSKYVLNTQLSSAFDRANITSTRIGPALSWDQVFWDWKSLDPVNEENVSLSIYAIDQDSRDSLLVEGLSNKTYDLSALNADKFPYMRIKADIVDTLFRTAPQLDNMHVLFQPAPDGVVDPITNFSFRSDTIFEGQDVFLHMAAKNISVTDMDSVEVRLSLQRENRSRLTLDTLMIAPLIANGPSIEFDYQFSTLDKSLEGLVNLIIEINPDRKQVESHYFNNTFIQSFEVIVDRFNPVMDVTFDGKHIINGDIISPRPEILIEVNDENPLVALDDSTTFELYWKQGTSAGVNFERIFLDDERVEWQPAQLPENKARLYFYPGKNYWLAEGDYTLRVQGKDKKGNSAGLGENFYEITFKVETDSKLTRILNYPNPFSTSTRFVYTLSGVELPEVFQIHIYTISGKRVKVVDLVELGDVNFGRNITEYAWDGTDDYGDRLANGVYLYKTVIRMPEQELKLRDEGVEQYFNNGFGKMYIMR